MRDPFVLVGSYEVLLWNRLALDSRIERGESLSPVRSDPLRKKKGRASWFCFSGDLLLLALLEHLSGNMFYFFLGLEPPGGPLGITKARLEPKKGLPLSTDLEKILSTFI